MSWKSKIFDMSKTFDILEIRVSDPDVKTFDILEIEHVKSFWISLYPRNMAIVTLTLFVE